MEDADIDNSDDDILTLYVRNVSMPIVYIRNHLTFMPPLSISIKTMSWRRFYRSGFDGKKYGACPACQRVFMVLMMKAARPAPGPRLQFLVATVPPGRPPMQLKRHGLRNLPAIIYRLMSTKTPSDLPVFVPSSILQITMFHFRSIYDSRKDALDTVEEIIDYIDMKVPHPNIASDNNKAESVTRDFFSKFCFFIKVIIRMSLIISAPCNLLFSL